MFEATLEEWFSIHSLDQWKDAEAKKIAQWAVDEFISRHEAEFLPAFSTN
jgi:hypothetical protein